MKIQKKFKQKKQTKENNPERIENKKEKIQEPPSKDLSTLPIELEGPIEEYEQAALKI